MLIISFSIKRQGEFSAVVPMASQAPRREKIGLWKATVASH